MKKLIIAAIALTAITAHAVETKQVCHDTVVKGKVVHQCKTVKIHKRFEGTKVPEPVKKPVAKKPAAKPVAKPAKKK